MEEELRYDGRRDAFDDLLQELGSQLSKTNLDSLEVLERVPEDLREKGGIKLLEYFRNQGRFTLWRTASLHDILRKCGRYDLAEVVKDRFQRNYPDLAESPKPKRASMQYERTASSLLVRSPCHTRSSSSPVPHRHRRASSLDRAQWPVEEENTASGTRSLVGPSHTRGFAASKSPTPSEFSMGSTYPPPLEEGITYSTMASWRPHGRSCDDCRLKEKAIDAVVRIVESKSCTDITYRSTDEESLKSKSEASLVMKGGSYNDNTPTLHRRNASSSDGGGQDTMSSFIANNLDEFEQASPSPDSSPYVDVGTTDAPVPSLPSPTSHYTPVTTTASRRLKLPRPISAYRKPQDSITWELKKGNLLKSLNKSGNEKLVFSEKIDLDVGHGKNNPKLSIVLYPKGLFHHGGKGVSLQANISVTDKCPPLSPSLLVQLNITVFGSQKQKALWKRSAQESVNMRSFYIHDLFSLQSTELEDHLLLEISVQIQKATEET